MAVAISLKQAETAKMLVRKGATLKFDDVSSLAADFEQLKLAAAVGVDLTVTKVCPSHDVIPAPS